MADTPQFLLFVERLFAEERKLIAVHWFFVRLSAG